MALAQSIEVNMDNPIDSPISAKSERGRRPFDFAFCNSRSTAIYEGSLMDDDILCPGCKAEVEYLRSIISNKKEYFRLNYFLLNLIWTGMLLSG